MSYDLLCMWGLLKEAGQYSCNLEWENSALAVRAGLDEEAELKAITINPVEILGVSGRVGSLESNKDADIVVFDKYPLTSKLKQHVY